MTSKSGGAIYPDLEGQTVVITGGASGIGASIVKAFARQGAKVGFIDINAHAGVALAELLIGAGSTVHFAACDLRDIAALRAAIAEIRKARPS
eukprot:gene12929-13030_t